MAKKTIDEKAIGEDVAEDNILSREKSAKKDDEIDMELAPEEGLTDQQIDLEDAEKETQTKEQLAPEVLALHSDNDSAKELNKKETSKNISKTKKSKSVKKAPKQRSKKYQNASEDFDKNKKYPVEQAVELAKKMSYSKFDGTVTVDIKLAKSKKDDESIRGIITLPHGTGKQMKIEIASDALIEKIKTGYTDFDVLITSPAMMPKLGQVAKILGPKGKMPNPKDGTVVDNPEEAAKGLNMTARYRADIGKNLHISIGKTSWEDNKLVENIKTVLKALAHLKKDNLAISATMGPSVKISI
ncbi:MAG: hypothetical protein NTZ65_02010 [Candidatus Berkelbacteria bacterium]|nr:hypothetical protein [Candidatus Berkelbacteria bacterium]